MQQKKSPAKPKPSMKGYYVSIVWVVPTAVLLAVVFSFLYTRLFDKPKPEGGPVASANTLVSDNGTSPAMYHFLNPAIANSGQTNEIKPFREKVEKYIASKKADGTV